MAARGLLVRLRATGQTGILITVRGIAVDAVVADFIAGPLRRCRPLIPRSLGYHRGAGLALSSRTRVTLGLLHGSQPDALVLLSRPHRKSAERASRTTGDCTGSAFAVPVGGPLDHPRCVRGGIAHTSA